MKEEIIDDYIAVSEQLGKDEPTLQDYLNNGNHKRKAIYDTFGSFNDLKHKALFKQGKQLYKKEAYLRREYVDKGRSMHDIANEWGTQDGTVHSWMEKYGIDSRSRSEAHTDGDVSKLHDEEWLRTQYVKEERHGTDIAEECGVSSDTVYSWLEKHGVEIRDVGVAKSDGDIEALRDEERLREMYDDMGLSTFKIADELNVHPSSVHRHIVKFGIETRPSPLQSTDGDLELLNDAEYLRELHIENHMTTTEIGKQLSVAGSTVYVKLREFGIEPRGHMSKTADYDKLNDYEYLRKQYVEEKRSMGEIADLCNCSRQAVYDRLEEIGIEREQYRERYFRSGLDIASGMTDGDIEKLYDEEYVREQYLENELSLNEIGAKLGLSETAVLRALKRYGIERRSLSESVPTGLEHHNFKPFDTGYYGPNWDEKKLRARKRDHCKCQVCGINDAEHLEKYGRVNSVHHIIARSKFIDDSGVFDYERANKMDNLITLCSDHHPKYEGVPIDTRHASD